MKTLISWTLYASIVLIYLNLSSNVYKDFQLHSLGSLNQSISVWKDVFNR